MSTPDDNPFGTWSPEAMDEAAEAAKGKKDIFEWPAGDTAFRMLPPLKGQTQAIVPVTEHWFDRAGEEKAAHVVCPGQGCPICAESARLKASPSEDDNDLGFRIGAKTVGYANAIIRGQEALGVQVVKLSTKAFRDATKLAKNQTTGGNFTRADDEGFDLIMSRTGQQMKTRYELTAARRSSPLVSDAVVQEIGSLAEVAAQAKDLSVYASKTPLKKVFELWGGEAPASTSKQLPSGERQVQGTVQTSGARAPSRTAQDDLNAPADDSDIPF